jgi:hypothetical protein
MIGTDISSFQIVSSQVIYPYVLFPEIYSSKENHPHFSIGHIWYTSSYFPPIGLQMGYF